MRNSYYTVFCFFLMVHAGKTQRGFKDCDLIQYHRILKEADSLQEKGAFIDAKNRYEASKIYACRQNERDLADSKVDKLFEVVEILRRDAEQAKKASIIAISELNAQQEKTNQALYETEKAKLIAENAFNKANKLINAFYFYNGIALARNEVNDFFYIDIEGNEISKLGHWIYAEAFHEGGFAKVKKYNSLPMVMGGIYDYILDTSGVWYRVAYNVNRTKGSKGAWLLRLAGLPDLGGRATALDLSYNGLNKFPSKALKKGQLLVLLLNNNTIDQIPSGISKLKNLTHINLSNNQINKLPESLVQLQSLTVLDLSNNDLRELPYQFDRLGNLKVLNLIGNPISETELTRVKLLIPNCRVLF